MKRALFSIFVVLFFCVPPTSAQVAIVRLDKPIHPITSEYVRESIVKANLGGYRAIIIEIDTPGGYVTSTQEIERVIISSKLPVIAYIAPTGARAASAGFFLTMACDLALMAPGTNIGAAHPVFGMPGSSEVENTQSRIMNQKVENDLAAHARTFAQNRGRNVEISDKIVRESISLTDQEALRDGIIDGICKSEPEVVDFISNRTISRFDGRKETIELKSKTVTEIPMTYRQNFLSSLANPELAYILLMIGILGLFLEIKSPGLVFPGVIGGLSLILYLISLPLLPVNVVGLLLIILGIVFLIVEVKVVSYGSLTVGGVISLIIGSIILYQGPIPELRLEPVFGVSVGLSFGLIVAFLIRLVIKAHKKPVETGVEGMIGIEAKVLEQIAPDSTGKIFVRGEIWNAESDSNIDIGTVVKIESQKGLTLKVTPKN